MDNDNSEETEKKELKIILLGECGVGKTNIILRYMKIKFDEDSVSTTSSNYMMKSIEKGNKVYRLNVWDTAGQERFRSITKIFLQDSSIIILVYSINDMTSFRNLNYWYDIVKQNCRPNIIVAIVGNKTDCYLEQEVPDEEAENYAKERNAIFKLISAKADKRGIDALFDLILDEYIERKIDEKINESQSVKISSTKFNKTKKKKRHLC